MDGRKAAAVLLWRAFGHTAYDVVFEALKKVMRLFNALGIGRQRHGTHRMDRARLPVKQLVNLIEAAIRALEEQADERIASRDDDLSQRIEELGKKVPS